VQSKLSRTDKKNSVHRRKGSRLREEKRRGKGKLAGDVKGKRGEVGEWEKGEGHIVATLLGERAASFC